MMQAITSWPSGHRLNGPQITVWFSQAKSSCDDDKSIKLNFFVIWLFNHFSIWSFCATICLNLPVAVLFINLACACSIHGQYFSVIFQSVAFEMIHTHYRHTTDPSWSWLCSATSCSISVWLRSRYVFTRQFVIRSCLEGLFIIDC